MPMRGSPQIAALEARHHLPLREILVRALNEHATVREAAESLGVKHKTLAGWVVRYRVDVRRRLVAEVG